MAKKISILLKIIGVADGSVELKNEDGGPDLYLQWFRPRNIEAGMPMICFTGKPELAQKFDSMTEAMDLWKTPIGIRADGKPDRPLTAFSVTFTTYEQEIAA